MSEFENKSSEGGAVAERFDFPKSAAEPGNSQPEIISQFRTLLTDIHRVLETRQPQQWWRGVYRQLIKAKRHPEHYAPEIQAFISDYADSVIGLLREQAQDIHSGDTSSKDSVDISERTLHIIHDTAKLIKSPKEKDRPFEINHLPLELVFKNNDRFRISKGENLGHELTFFEIRSETGDWHSFPLPMSDTMFHKGGFPRVVLKILAGAPPSTIEAELPPNDFDVVATGHPKKAYTEAGAIGVDLEGVEMLEKMNFEQLCKSRDINLNGCFIGKNELVYSTDAYNAAKSGKIAIEGYTRGIYGSDRFFYQGVELFKNRGLMRLMKTVTEGKALSFDFIPLNQQVDLGIYWLVLMRKFSKKENFNELADRLFYLGKQCGQIYDGETSIFDVIDRVHSENPFFNFDEVALDQVGVAKWLNKKLLKYIDSAFRQTHSIANALEFTRLQEDTRPYEVSLNGFEPRPDKDLNSRWTEFLERCRQRNKQDMIRPLVFSS